MRNITTKSKDKDTLSSLEKERCPCNPRNYFSECCDLYISGKQLPKTPEALMRSRYSAYTKGNIFYIQKTMCGPALLGFNADEAQQWANESQWLGLEVINSAHESVTKGHVEFIALYRLNQKDCKIHERSEFHYINDRWYYMNGKMIP